MRLQEFLAKLSIDPDRFAAFVRNPQAVMDAVGLDLGDRAALTGGVADNLWSALLDSEPPLGTSPNGSWPAVGPSRQPGGSLIVIGTGIRTVGQLTLESIGWIRESDVVLYLIADPVAETAIKMLSPHGAVSMRGFYGEGASRKDSYEAMVEHILTCVRAGQQTCVAFYGHPGVFAYPSHESIRRARAEGYQARMLPAISAEDCLFADLGVDPAVNGCQSFEATDFILHYRTVDTSSQLVLWQIGVLGDWTYRSNGYDLRAFPLLVNKLCELYGPLHEGYIYEAAVLPGLAPKITRAAMASLGPEWVNAGSTLYVPPAHQTQLNRPIAQAMGIVP